MSPPRPRTPNPRVKNPCPFCYGWGFFMVSFDPDVDMDCPECINGERRSDDGNRSAQSHR